jgi:hypothetical protein
MLFQCCRGLQVITLHCQLRLLLGVLCHGQPSALLPGCMLPAG